MSEQTDRPDAIAELARLAQANADAERPGQTWLSAGENTAAPTCACGHSLTDHTQGGCFYSYNCDCGDFTAAPITAALDGAKQR